MSKPDHLSKLSEVLLSSVRSQSSEKSAAFFKEIELLKHEYHIGRLDVRPHWWTDLEKVQLSRFQEHLRPIGMLILPNVSMSKIIGTMKGANRDILLAKDLCNNRLDLAKIFMIIEYWKNGLKLLPATFMLVTDSHLEIDNGRHRLNTAWYFGAVTVPILVSYNEANRIMDLLEVDPGTLK